MTCTDVLIPLYNQESFILDTIKSIKAQSHLPGRIIVLNDGSTDSGPKLAKEHGCEVVSWKKNMGIGMARQQGLYHVFGHSKYFSFLSGDDTWSPFFLEKSLEAMEEKTITFTQYYQCNEKMVPMAIFSPPEPSIQEILGWARRYNMFINFSSLLIPNHQGIPGFNPLLRYGEDLAFTLECLLRGWKFKLIPEPLVYYRMGYHQWTAKGWDQRTKQVFFPLIQELIGKIEKHSNVAP